MLGRETRGCGGSVLDGRGKKSSRLRTVRGWRRMGGDDLLGGGRGELSDQKIEIAVEKSRGFKSHCPLGSY